MASVVLSPPPQVTKAIKLLIQSGYEAYLVGGCVRDSLLELSPCDWDITTNALPLQVKNVFSAIPVLETGIKHGTVTVLIDHFPLEITTYRTDDKYTDHRHPDTVTFTPNLTEDLARRDFTVNAMAWSPSIGLVDPFGGLNDLNQKTLRCVGNANQRFEEDSLRILRALRFSSVLGFTIDPNTALAIHEKKGLLSYIALERIQKELVRLLCGKNAQEILLDYPDVFDIFIPGYLNMKGFDQQNPHHIYDLLEHTVKSVTVIDPDPILRLAMLFHDIGKLKCFSVDENGIGHFYGHSHISAHITKEILSHLRFDRNTIEMVSFLVKYHDISFPSDPKTIKRWLNRFGETKLRFLIQVKCADTLALAPAYHNRISTLYDFSQMLEDILKQQACFSLSQLAVNGNDLIQAGVLCGPEVGRALRFLLEAVIDEKVPNQRESLLTYWKKTNG